MSYDRPRRSKTNVNKNTSSTHWIYGFHTVLAALKNPKRKIKRLVTSKNFSLPPIEKIEKKQILAENLSNAELKALGRNHDKSSALNAINILAERNITVDLMYGIELQTIQSFEDT